VIVPNFVAIGRTVAKMYGDLTVFKMAADRHVGFLKI